MTALWGKVTAILPEIAAHSIGGVAWAAADSKVVPRPRPSPTPPQPLRAPPVSLRIILSPPRTAHLLLSPPPLLPFHQISFHIYLVRSI